MKRTCCVVAILELISGCQSNVVPPKPIANGVHQNAYQKRFEDTNSGITLMYPADWKPVTGTQSQLKIASADGGQFTVDIPVLPFHIPGMIPIDSVRSGFVDDAKKKISDATVTNLPDPSVPDAKQHWVKLAGHENGKAVIDEAVLIVHGDHVYILSIDTDDKNYDHMHSVLDQAIKSVQWTK